MFLALGSMVVLLGLFRLLAAQLVGEARLRRVAWLWIATGCVTALAQL